MVGKVNLPPDADKRKGLKGSASGGPGLNAIDEERAASMADEGGASGSAVESQEALETPPEPSEEPKKRPVRRRGR
ncbi:MAG TPA: hypothetical protein VGN09_11230 [Vicinamibacteria bacterium]|jgi:hypothetical protein